MGVPIEFGVTQKMYELWFTTGQLTQITNVEITRQIMKDLVKQGIFEQKVQMVDGQRVKTYRLVK